MNLVVARNILSRRGLALRLKKRLARVGAFLLGLLALFLLFHTLLASEKTFAYPVIRSQGLKVHIWADNVCFVQIENLGDDGWVRVSYGTGRTWTEIRREPGIVTWFKNVFTSDGSEGFNEESHHAENTWVVYSWFRKGEMKWVTFDLPGHSSSDFQDGPSVMAVKSVPDHATIK